ncbi:SDR family oxidoreductase [Streptomyces achromogenes]|uniref:SDR family oxidoreductase n=1 Tax=Streptomyces achromogenes TaxID=67255 RepID=UPI0036F5708E
MRAAVPHETGREKLEVLDDVEAVRFGPGKVRIRVRATGLCHSDLSAMNGVLPQPAPFVPGHEGAGEVVDVGDGVGHLKPGDRVLLCWLPACGNCPACRRGQTRLCLAGFMNAGTPDYAAAKGGIVGLTTSTALALAKYGVTANVICPRARTRMTEGVFAGFGRPEEGLDPLAPEHVAPLVGYLASPAAAGVNGRLFVVHGGMVAVLDRPRVQVKYDSERETFTYDELDALLTPHFAGRPEGETFAAAEVLSLKRG